MRIKRMHKRMSIALLVFTITVMIVFNESSRPVWLRSVTESVSGLLDSKQLYDRSDIDINSNDVLVVLNIPRTGILPLTNHVVRHAKLERPCSCKWYRTKCQCLNKKGYHWLFNAHNTTGFVCGENADYTDIKYSCPMDYWFQTTGHDHRQFRRYHLMTMIRDPISRYVSEWLELKSRDAYFLNEPRLWRKQPVELQKKGLRCLLGKRLAMLTLDDFVTCPDNPANNRMTKMLANIKYVETLEINSKTKYNQALLLSAQNVLRRTAFFGLHHRLNDTQVLLEEVLGVRFNSTLNFKAMDDSYKQYSPALKHKILMVNDLDAKLFVFAKELFEARIAQWRYKHNKVSAVGGKKKMEGDNSTYKWITYVENDKVVLMKQSKDGQKLEVLASGETAEKSDDEEEDGEEEEGTDKVDEDDEAENEKEIKGGKEEEEDEKEAKEEKTTQAKGDAASGKETAKIEGGKGKEEKETEVKDKEEASKTKPSSKPQPSKQSTITTKAASSSDKPGSATSKKEGSGDDKNNQKENNKATPEKSSASDKGKGQEGKTESSEAKPTTGAVAMKVEPMGEDVSDFFKKLEAAKGEETKQMTSVASQDSSRSGSAQAPKVGEKFRQLQGHSNQLSHANMEHLQQNQSQSLDEEAGLSVFDQPHNRSEEQGEERGQTSEFQQQGTLSQVPGQILQEEMNESQQNLTAESSQLLDGSESMMGLEELPSSPGASLGETKLESGNADQTQLGLTLGQTKDGLDSAPGSSLDEPTSDKDFTSEQFGSDVEFSNGELTFRDKGRSGGSENDLSFGEFGSGEGLGTGKSDTRAKAAGDLDSTESFGPNSLGSKKDLNLGEFSFHGGADSSTPAVQDALNSKGVSNSHQSPTGKDSSSDTMLSKSPGPEGFSLDDEKLGLSKGLAPNEGGLQTGATADGLNPQKSLTLSGSDKDSLTEKTALGGAFGISESISQTDVQSGGLETTADGNAGDKFGLHSGEVGSEGGFNEEGLGTDGKSEFGELDSPKGGQNLDELGAQMSGSLGKSEFTEDLNAGTLSQSGGTDISGIDPNQMSSNINKAMPREGDAPRKVRFDSDLEDTPVRFGPGFFPKQPSLDPEMEDGMVEQGSNMATARFRIEPSQVGTGSSLVHQSEPTGRFASSWRRVPPARRPVRGRRRRGLGRTRLRRMRPLSLREEEKQVRSMYV